MNYETFLLRVKEELKSYLDKECSGCTVNVRKVLKNNGVELDALTIINVECRTAPTVYLNGYYEEFNEGKSIEDITEEIYGMFRKNYGRININAEDFADFDKVRGQIAYKVINARKNGRLLKKIPHVKQLDLAIVFYCILKCNKYENATTLIYNQHLEMWGVELSDVYEAAVENTPRILPYEIKSMGDIILEMLSDDTNEDGVCEEGFYGGAETDILTDKLMEELTGINQEPQMYVLTNIYKLNGAAVIFYENVLKSFAEEQGRDLIILPSSIHEVILIPVDDGMKMEDFKSMIREVNYEEVEPSEILSDHAYMYKRDINEIIM